MMTVLTPGNVVLLCGLLLAAPGYVAAAVLVWVARAGEVPRQ